MLNVCASDRSSMCPTSHSRSFDVVVRALDDAGVGYVFTTTDLAASLRLPEYAVRGSVSTLMLRGHVKHIGWVSRTTSGGYPYDCKAYAWAGIGKAPDFEALYRAFGLIGGGL